MKNLLICTILLLGSIVHGQGEFVLKGGINTESGDLIFGEAILFQNKVEQAYRFALVEEGKFAFDPVSQGEYRLQINSLGYVKHEQVVQLNSDKTLEISLQTNEEELSEVVVTAKRKIFESNNGNLRLNVEQTDLSSLPSPVDILSRMPGLIISPNQNSASVIGKGNPLIYVGNQRISFEEFSSLPVESIKSIEVINNPSVKYEANGRAVLLIERTENYVDGYNVRLRNVSSQRREFNNWSSLTTNLKKGKSEFRLNVGYNYLHPFEGHMAESNVLFENVLTEIDSETIPDRTQINYGGGWFYKINKKDYFSINFNGRTHNDIGVISSTTSLIEPGINETLETNVSEQGERGLFSANMNYNKSLASINGNLFFGGQFSRNFRNNDSTINVISMDTNETYKEIRDQDFSVSSAAFRVDFEKRMDNKARWDSGINLSMIQANAFSNFDFLEQLPSILSVYDYDESNIAAYTEYSGEYAKLNYTLGFRAEYNVVKGKFEDMDDLLVDRSRLNLFPRLNVVHQIDSTKTISFDYINSIQRPHFLNATTISTFIGPVNEYQRNINLRSSIINEASLTYQFGKQSLALRYSFERWPTLPFHRWDESTERIFSSPENWESAQHIRLVYVMPLEKNKWRSTFYLMPTLSLVKEERVEPSSPRPFIYIYNNTSFQATEKTNLGVRIWGLPDRNDGVFENKAFYVLSASVQHNFNKQFSISFNANDILRQWEIENTSIINNIERSSLRFTDFHEFSLTLSYKFGKQFKSNYKNKDVDDNLERL